MSGTGTHWLSAVDFKEAKGAALVIRGNRKTSSGDLRNHIQLVGVVIKSQTCTEISGDQWEGKKKMRELYYGEMKG